MSSKRISNGLGMTFVSQIRISLSSKTDCADAIKVFADFLRSFKTLSGVNSGYIFRRIVR